MATYPPKRYFSYGGGIQSTAALVLAAQRVIEYPVFVFCNVGADSEDPATLQRWQEIREKRPALFWKAVDLEKTLGQRQVERGQPRIYLSRRLKPLDMLTATDITQNTLADTTDFCDSGYCFFIDNKECTHGDHDFFRY